MDPSHSTLLRPLHPPTSPSARPLPRTCHSTSTYNYVRIKQTYKHSSLSLRLSRSLEVLFTLPNFPRCRTDPGVTDAPSSFTRLLRGDPRRCVGVAGEGGGGASV